MPLTKTFHGFIENTTDTLLIIEACRTGVLPTVNRRLIERERCSIKSGTIIVFDENESGIKRWTDGFLWSPSRILGDFLVYRELENKDNRRPDISTLTSYHGDISIEGENTDNLELQQERALVGSLTTSNTSYNFKKDGLIKKTIRVLVNGNYLHIINYYSKNDVLSNLLPIPSKSQQLSCLTISSDLIPHLNGCNTNNYGSRQKVRGGGNRIAGIAKNEYRPYPSRSDLIRPSRLQYPPYTMEESSYNIMYNNHKPSILNPSPPTSTHASPSQPIHSESYYPRMTPFTELPHPHQEKPHGLFQAKFMKSDTQDPISPSPTPSPPIVCQSKVLEPYRHESTSDSYYQRRAMDYYS